MREASRAYFCLISRRVARGGSAAELLFGDRPRHEGQCASQRDLIDAQVARFPEDRRRGDACISSASLAFGEERVFAEEIKLAAQRVGEQYGSASAPCCCSTTGAISRRIRSPRVVVALRARCARPRDGPRRGRAVPRAVVAWLGGRNHRRVERRHGPSTLSAATLAEVLEESGIRWRVIVVSACYSGAFIEPLADNHTIVITAAAKNRTSFGCSDERDLTYFGEAFYRDALPGSTDLRAAFEAARRRSPAREGRGRQAFAAAGILRAADGN